LTTGYEIHAAILFAAAECPLKRESADFDDSLFASAERIREESDEY
jgi:hypothetical protein